MVVLLELFSCRVLAILLVDINLEFKFLVNKHIDTKINSLESVVQYSSGCLFMDTNTHARNKASHDLLHFV